MRWKHSGCRLRLDTIEPMEWLVHLGIAVPPTTTDTELSARMQRESERAAQLFEDGRLIRLWRVPGRRANWGLWEAEDATTLHSALQSLPMYEWASIEVHPLAEHPNEPDDRTH